MKTKEHKIELDFIKKLEEIKYIYRQDIKDKNSLEQNFREKFEALNRVKLTDSELFTSFKASTLLKNNKDMHKILFVVDRKDLDRQTREEFNKFQEGLEKWQMVERYQA